MRQNPVYVVPSAPSDRLPLEGETIFTSAQKPDYKINAETGCWEWEKFRTTKGYAGCHAHRLYWERANGPIPEGFHVHHLCRNPPCVNPAHLEAVPNGSHIAFHQQEAKRVLTFDDAREIRRLGANPAISATELAERYGVSRRHIADIWAGVRFKEPGVERVAWTKNCRMCGDEFTSKKRSAAYCSVQCRTRYNTKGTPRPERWTAEKDRRAA